MKTKLITSFLLFYTLLITSQSFTLTIINGEGSGTYQEGETIHIWSNTPANNTVFTKWTGNEVAYLERKNEWHTTLIIPQNTNIVNVTLTANFETLPASTLRGSKSFMLEGQNGTNLTQVAKECFYAIPPSPKGIVFLFHGTGGKGENFFERFEPYNIIKDLVKNNYAVFTLDANEVTSGDQNGDGKLRWNNVFSNPANNVDLRNVETLKNAVINEFALDETLPVFSLGMSNGAVFSDLCATVLGFEASAHITAKGRNDIYKRPDIAPVIWIMSDNDNNESADNTLAFANYTEMQQRQTASWILMPKTPIHNKRFTRSLQGISEQQSIAIFNKLKANNYLDAQNILTIDDVRQIPTSFYNNLDLSIAQKVEVLEQLLYANADHILHSEYNKAIISFFDERLQVLSSKNTIYKNDKFTVYPNPTAEVLHIRSIDTFSKVQIQVFSVDGKLVIQKKNENKIDIRKLKNGIYFLKLTLNEETQTQKIIKK